MEETIVKDVGFYRSQIQSHWKFLGRIALAVKCGDETVGPRMEAGPGVRNKGESCQ